MLLISINTILLIAILVIVIILLTKRNKENFQATQPTRFTPMEQQEFVDDKMQGALQFARMV